MTQPKKIYVKCAKCPRKVWRQAAAVRIVLARGGGIACAACKRARNTKYRRKDPAHRRAYLKHWRATHVEQRREYLRGWREENRQSIRRRDRRWKRRQRVEAEAVLAELPCLDCGMNHSRERREAILRRMLPCSAADIHEAWPCFWGVGGQANKSSAGARMLLRDLQALGAVRRGGTWYPAEETRVAA